MKYCIHFEGEPDENGVIQETRLLDISVVADDHEFGRAADGTWHWESGLIGSP